MPEFKNREEYERWKAEKLKQNQEKEMSGDSKKSESRLSPASKPARPMPSGGLSEIDALLTRSWELFKERFRVLLPLQILSIALLAASIGAVVGAACMIPLLLIKGMVIPQQPQKFF